MPTHHSTPRSRRHRGPQPAPEQQQQGFFQPKLAIGRPGDQYEREADAVADAVVNQGNPQATSQSPAAVQRMPITPVGSGGLQRLATPEEEKMPATNDARMEEDRQIQEKPIDGRQLAPRPRGSTVDSLHQDLGGGRIQKMDAPQEEEPVQAKEEEEEPVQAMEEEEPMQTKEEEEKPMQAKEEEEQPLQAKSAGAPTPAAPNFSARLSARRGRGETLPQPVRREMERGIGADFSRVRIHRDAEAVQLNKQIRAQAFTQGNDLYFNSGKYDPGSREGKRLLAHELTHVVQQGAGEKQVQRFPDIGSAVWGSVSAVLGRARGRVEEAGQLPRQRPESDSTSNFCTPYTSTIEAMAAKIYARSVLPTASGSMFGSEVAGLWNQYLSGRSSSRKKFTNGTTIGYGFAASQVIRSRVNLLMRIAAARYSLFEHIAADTWTDVPVEDIFTEAELKHPINFSNPFDIPGHIAGGVSGSDFGPDTRQLKGNIQAFRETDEAGNTTNFKLKSAFEFEVLDAVDFCPGGMGAAGLETVLTIPLSRLESTGMAWDVPFQVNFNPTPVQIDVTPTTLPGVPGSTVGFGSAEQPDDRRSRGDRTREAERGLSEKNRISQRTSR